MNQQALPVKPLFGQPCNGCGYCCTMQPCALAEEFLKCTEGPCIALETRDGRTLCGLVRNPLTYLFQAAHPEQDVPVLDDAPDSEVGRKMSSGLASALGVGLGCDSADDEESLTWPALLAQARIL